jgi:COMPASS component SWD1
MGDDDEEVSRQVLLPAEEVAGGPKGKLDQGLIAVFSKRGTQIYIGTPQGKVFVKTTATLALENTLQVSTASGGCGIKAIEFNRTGTCFLVNSVDRILRVYSTEDCILQHKFQEVVERIPWRTCCFANGGVNDYIIAGSAEEAQHRISVWDRESGSLLKILEGPKEGLLNVVWHPARPIIASTSTHGVVYIWGVPLVENWSAFAPDFKELEENIEYVEREDEFDHVDESKVEKRKQQVEDVIVDVTSVDEEHFGSSDEEPCDDELIFLPTTPMPDPIVEPLKDASDETDKKRKGNGNSSAGGGGGASHKKSKPTGKSGKSKSSGSKK